MPDDLATALAADPGATAAFAVLGRSDRYALILPVLKARTPAARDKAIRAAVTATSRQHSG
ncbi:YdeI/OmpD-associated family protein [Microlunatus sp. GCM10028923]|uniref:YdeI/OmpD-associated family protein n=1 Tax=Microlunatus sp. GCM10028923 TaxID=3273400 RepID=UPI00360D3330